MTNYEWLLQMGGEERQAWFDAEHVDANDALTRKGDVREDDVCANDANATQDSREKLEADASELTADYAASGDVCDALYGGIVGLLDRQDAITERELCRQCDWPSLAAQPDLESQERIAELAAQVDELQAAFDAICISLAISETGKPEVIAKLAIATIKTLANDREHYRKLFSQAITQAAEIVNLQP